jgi:hypothetical protein
LQAGRFSAILFACLEGLSPSDPVPRNDVTMRSPRVAARRRHAAEEPGGSATFAEQEKRNHLAKAIAAAATAAGTLVPALSWDLQPLSFDQNGAPGVRREKLYPNYHARILQPWCCTTPTLSGHKLQHVV